MKKIWQFFGLFACLTVATFTQAQQKSSADPTGFPGDNFSLQGALEMFQKASSPEEFEKLINTENNHVNNLDLDKDGKTDYVKVIDKSEKNVHAFILQVPISQKENQDIAVIEVEKTADNNAVIQIIGNKDMYGKEVIIEPGTSGKDNASVNKSNNNSKSATSDYSANHSSATIINVWYWPSVTFIYGPLYAPWISPWRWGSYPGWWTPSRAVSWQAWYPRCVAYNRSYVAANTYRISGGGYLYTLHRADGVSVSRQGGVAVGTNGVAAGTKTTVTGPAGRSATRVAGTVVGPNGAARGVAVRRR